MTTAAPALSAARAAATFPVEEVTRLLDGGPERTAQRRELMAVVKEDRFLAHRDDAHRDRVTRYQRAISKARRMQELKTELGLEDDPQGYLYLKMCVADDDPTTLHELMFVPNIEALCTEEQKSYWLPRCRNWQVIGCYAQTEIAHGSNVRALQTTATYLPGEQQFEIHTPTIEATKFWPGTLGRTANTAMVIARLVTPDGVDRGIHNFIVPIRDPATHVPLPGVTVGDIGAKLGYNNMDNGFLSLDRVRIPRENMAAKFAHVDAEGNYHSTSDPTSKKLAGLTMTQVRATIVQLAGRALAQACTIAIRYSYVRVQGFDEHQTREHQVIDYSSQQHRLLPLLAAAYCFHFNGLALGNMMDEATALVVSGAPVPPALLGELHATSSGLKALCTTVAADGIEVCRRACGGHGYLQSSGFPELSGTYLQSVTVEGDNYLLPQQTTKFLLKALAGVRAGQPVPDSCQYLSKLSPDRDAAPCGSMSPEFQWSPVSPSDLDDGQALLDALAHRAAYLVASVGLRLEKLVEEQGRSLHEAWQASLMEINRASTAHCEFNLLRNFQRYVVSAPCSPETAHVLQSLCLLYGCWRVDEGRAELLEAGFLSAEHVELVRERLRNLLLDLRNTNALALVDAWEFDDRQLKSAIGRYDGNVYEALLDAAKKNPMNTELHEADYKRTLRPLSGARPRL